MLTIDFFSQRFCCNGADEGVFRELDVVKAALFIGCKSSQQGKTEGQVLDRIQSKVHDRLMD
jgi:hypothetical protein